MACHAMDMHTPPSLFDFDHTVSRFKPLSDLGPCRPISLFYGHYKVSCLLLLVLAAIMLWTTNL